MKNWFLLWRRVSCFLIRNTTGWMESYTECNMENCTGIRRKTKEIRMPYSNPTIRINKDMKYKYQYKIDVGKLSNQIWPTSGIPCGKPYHVAILGIHFACWYRFSAVWTLRKHLQSWFRPIDWLKSPTTKENTIKHRLEYLLDGCQKINAALLLFRSPKRVKSSPTEDIS